MSISAERLTLATEGLHRAAESTHRAFGYAAPALLLIPADGAPTLAVIPEGLPGDDQLRAFVQRAGATAIALTGEAWVSTPGIRPATLRGMPLDDLPRPKDDPQRRDAIVTLGVGNTPNGPTTVLNISMIESGAGTHGTTLRTVSQAEADLRTDDTAAFLASLLL
jgi:hypothetical protein